MTIKDFCSSLHGTISSHEDGQSMYDSSFELPSLSRDSTATIDMLMLQHIDPANPFAFSAEQLVQLVDLKHLEFLGKMNGIESIARGLHSNLKTGLQWNEPSLPYVRMLDLQNKEYEAHVERNTWLDKKDGFFPQREAVFGLNKLPELEELTLLHFIWESFQDKTLILLTISAMISLSVGIYEDLTTIEYDMNGNVVTGVKWIEGVAIIIAVTIVVLVGSINDLQKEKQFRQLNAKKEDRKVMVTRSGQQMLLSVYDVQVGDILTLEPGDIVCADGIFIEGHNLRCDESAATGESDAVMKLSWEKCLKLQSSKQSIGSEASVVSISKQVYNHPQLFEDRVSISSSVFDNPINPFLISGSKVLEGICTYIVTAVGPNSFHGRTMMSLRTKDENTPLQDKLDVLAGYIAKFGLSAAAFLFTTLMVKCVFGYATAELPISPSDVISQFMRILITTVTVIVVAVPEGLPLAVTLALAYATQRMLQDNNLVRILAACETMGNATTICSDKTGTLTQNTMSVVAGTIGTSFRFLKDPPASRHDLIDINDVHRQLHLPIRNFINQALAVNSTAFNNTDAFGGMHLVGNKTETAMLNFAKDYLKSERFEMLRSQWTIERIYPFSSSRKLMATVIRIPIKESATSTTKVVYRVHIKGASELLLSKCHRIVSMHDSSYDRFRGLKESDNYDLVDRIMTDANRMRMHSIIQSYATRCLRTLAICYQDFDSWPEEKMIDEVIECGGLTLISIVGIEDPLRPGVKEAVATCQKAGVCVRMVTGDNILTAKSIARQCGIYTYGTLTMEGPQFRKLSKQERIRILPQLRVLARSSPEDKRLLVNDLKSMGEVVAVTGDGTNDGPALKAADVGFSMGISGTEVAKEASSIILMDDNFSSIIRAISWGRGVNDSVKKFLLFQLTINVTAVLLTIISSIMNNEQKSILTSVQLLWVNLIMDTFAALALATDPPSPDLLNRLPEARSAPLIDVCMWKMIIGQSIYQLLVMIILLYTDILDLSNDPPTLKTVIFTTFVFCQIFNEVNCRRIDNQLNIFKGIKKNKLFMAIFSISVSGQVFIVEGGGAAFQTVPLSRHHWMMCVLIGLISIPIGASIRVIPDELFIRNRPESIILDKVNRERSTVTMPPRMNIS
ncbi:PMCA-type calcium-translocating P-type ATPase [Pilobolus umbonatus]|nr:PMCA-type calcium-translocating P-type ATPase [Pilobolus umbonatus]